MRVSIRSKEAGAAGTLRTAALALAWLVLGAAAATRVSAAADAAADRGAALVELRLPAGEPALGHASAPLTMVEFTDYQCPYCRRFQAEVWPKLKHDYIDTGKLRFIARDLPLDIHASAGPASEAAHCAGEQGKFWAMHAALLAGAADFASGGIERRASALGLDRTRFEECVRAQRYAQAIEAHVREADAAGIEGTPGFIIGRVVHGGLEGVRVDGALPYEQFDALLRQLLAAGSG
jgi:protein-disulfide isomerase